MKNEKGGKNPNRLAEARVEPASEGSIHAAGSECSESPPERSPKSTGENLHGDSKQGVGRVDNIRVEPTPNDAPGPSRMAARIQRLRSSSLKAYATRKKVPHTLFWSLFRSEIEEVRARKEKARRERDLYLAGVDEESA